MHTNKKVVDCTDKERAALRVFLAKGRHSARENTRARILLESHDGKSKNSIATLLRINRSTVQNVRDRYAKGGLEHALKDRPRPGQPPKLDDTGEAYLVALATSDAPDGRDHWTLKLLQARMIKDKKVKSISDVCILTYLQKRKIKPWLEKNVVYSDHHT